MEDLVGTSIFLRYSKTKARKMEMKNPTTDAIMTFYLFFDFIG